MHPVQEYPKIQIPDKRYRTNTFRTFWSTRSTSALRYLGLDHFSRFGTKICKIQVRLWNKLACLISWRGFVSFLNTGYFPFLGGISLHGWKHSGSQGSLYCTTRRSDNFQLVQSWFVTHRRKLEEVDFVA